MTAALQLGRIVWVTIPDPQGRNPKSRPAAIHSITGDGMVSVVAITSRIGMAHPDATVPIPWQRNGHPRTKLTRPSEAVCTWMVRLPLSEIRPTAGRVPVAEMMLINEILDRLHPPAAPPAQAVNPPLPNGSPP